MRKLTRKQLARYDGKDGSPAYTAYDGKIYDLSDSFLWQKGRHQVRHLAGQDLTGELETAPHGAELLERFPLVALLVDD
jgi:predicted heme/steroid binding protein